MSFLACLRPWAQLSVAQNGHQTPTKNIGSRGKPGAGEVALPREERTNCMSSAKWSSLKTHIHVTLNRLRRLHIYYTYICVYIYIIYHICISRSGDLALPWRQALCTWHSVIWAPTGLGLPLGLFAHLPASGLFPSALRCLLVLSGSQRPLVCAVCGC